MAKHWTNVWANKIPSIKNRSWYSLDYLYLSIILSTNGFSLYLEHQSTLYRWCSCSSECTIINKKQKQQKCNYYLECGVMCRSHKKFQEEYKVTRYQKCPGSRYIFWHFECCMMCMVLSESDITQSFEWSKFHPSSILILSEW